MNKTIKRSIAIMGFAAAWALPQARAEVVFTLQDLNSSAQVRAVADEGNPTAGMFQWQVDGVNQLAQQWFWYRVGSTGPERSIDKLNLYGSFLSDTNFDGQNDALVLAYRPGDSSFEIQTTYILTGGSQGSRASDISEIIRIRNLTGGANAQALDFSFFQYSNFNLGGQSTGQYAWFSNANTVIQGGNDLYLSETSVNKVPTHREAALVPVTLNSLEDNYTTTLSDTPGPGNSTGTGNVSWAFQWDFTLQPGGTFLFSKDKGISPVPEPGAILLLGTGLLLVARKIKNVRKV